MTTEVTTVTPETAVTEFARTCAEDGISGAPVMMVDGQLVGIVSKTDLLASMLDTHPHYGAAGDSSVWEDTTPQIADIMQTEVLTVASDAPLSVIAERMATDRYHRVLVVDDGKLMGIVTSIDLLAHFPSD